ncbi:hypothetical protein J7M02_07145 [Candidatus Aerophobetes bacterium]|nr:hypothetical protein [Candidatus Aerophobetes bacterium]
MKEIRSDGDNYIGKIGFENCLDIQTVKEKFLMKHLNSKVMLFTQLSRSQPTLCERQPPKAFSDKAFRI